LASIGFYHLKRGAVEFIESTKGESKASPEEGTKNKFIGFAEPAILKDFKLAGNMGKAKNPLENARGQHHCPKCAEGGETGARPRDSWCFNIATSDPRSAIEKTDSRYRA